MRWVLPPPLALASRSTFMGLTTNSLPAWTAHVSPRQIPLSIRHRQTMIIWYGTVYPLSIGGHPLGCPLGPTNPPRITLAAEPSGFRWWRFALHFSVTRSDIRTRRHSTTASAIASLHRRRSPTTRAKSAHPKLRQYTLPRWIIGAPSLDQ